MPIGILSFPKTAFRRLSFPIVWWRRNMNIKVFYWSPFTNIYNKINNIQPAPSTYYKVFTWSSQNQVATNTKKIGLIDLLCNLDQSYIFLRPLPSMVLKMYNSTCTDKGLSWEEDACMSIKIENYKNTFEFV